MHRGDHLPEHLAAPKQVAHVCARKPFDACDRRLWVKNGEVGAVALVLEMDGAAARVEGTVAAEAGRKDAIEEVDAVRDTEQDVARLADAEAVHRQLGRDEREHLERRLERIVAVLLAERAAETEAVEAHLADRLRAYPAQIVEAAALGNAEDRLPRARVEILPVRLETALRPSVGALHRLALVVVGLVGRGAFVEGEEDVRAKRMLYFDRAFGREAMQRAVEVRGEGDTLVVDDRERPVLARDALVVHRRCPVGNVKHSQALVGLGMFNIPN